MTRGSIYDFLHKHKGVFKIQSLLKVALDVSKGMNYLHQNNIIHRDLKTANLLMDEHEVSPQSLATDHVVFLYSLVTINVVFQLLNPLKFYKIFIPLSVSAKKNSFY